MAVKDAGELSVSTVRTKYGKANSDSTINPTAREPTVFDYSQANQFKVYLPIFPTTEWFVQSCNVPGDTMGQAVRSTPLIDMPMVGEKLTYDDFNMTFIVDEQFKNFREMHAWLVNMGAPQKTSQFQAISSNYVIRPDKDVKFYRDVNGVSTQVTGQTSDRDLYCDIQLFILSSKNNPVVKFTMFEAFPTSLSALDYGVNDTDTTYVMCNVSFAFTLYTVEAVGAAT